MFAVPSTLPNNAKWDRRRARLHG